MTTSPIRLLFAFEFPGIQQIMYVLKAFLHFQYYLSLKIGFLQDVIASMHIGFIGFCVW